MQGWHDIPNEIAIDIFSNLTSADLKRVAQVSHGARDIALQLLYAHPKLVSIHALRLFLSDFASRPPLTKYTRGITIYADEKADIDTIHRLDKIYIPPTVYRRDVGETFLFLYHLAGITTTTPPDLLSFALATISSVSAKAPDQAASSRIDFDISRLFIDYSGLGYHCRKAAPPSLRGTNLTHLRIPLSVLIGRPELARHNESDVVHPASKIFEMIPRSLVHLEIHVGAAAGINVRYESCRAYDIPTEWMSVRDEWKDMPKENDLSRKFSSFMVVLHQGSEPSEEIRVSFMEADIALLWWDSQSYKDIYHTVW